MITVEDKIRTFSKYVYDKEVKKSNEELNEITEKNKDLFEMKRKEIESKYKGLNDKANKKIDAECQKILAKAKIDAKNKTLNVRKDLLNSFLKEITASFELFIHEEEYNDYFKNILVKEKDVLSRDDVRVFLVERDIQKFGTTIMKDYPRIEITQMDDKNIGGVMIESTSAKVRIDHSLNTRINDWKNEIGIRLYEALEKQVK